MEQRKRLTIGVELVAKPELLLFLDEPTSGLDSDTAWSICRLLRKLADNGQAILCTIHQPSATLFQMFDRVNFLVDGKSVYFGDIGEESKTLISYFERHDAKPCGRKENPAEWLMDITRHSPGDGAKIDWAHKWAISSEREVIKHQLQQWQIEQKEEEATTSSESDDEFAAPFLFQLYQVTMRNFANDWRTPSYLYSKAFLTIGLVGSHYFEVSNDLLMENALGPNQWVFVLTTRRTAYKEFKTNYSQYTYSRCSLAT